MKINVTWSDIRNGRSARTTECMVALALMRQLGVDYASVGYGGGSLLVDGQLVGLYLPLAVRNRIKFWDRCHFVLPFSFELTTSGFMTGTDLQVPAPRQPVTLFERVSGHVLGFGIARALTGQLRNCWMKLSPNILKWSFSRSA
jgi:hypothetical protein